jgi:branched-chain amino acid transport system permease protein
MTAARPNTVEEGVILELDSVSRSFGGVHAVDHVSFSVPRGEITGMIGPNGAGKSTLLNLISGVEAPSSGRIRYEGYDITRESSHAHAARGIVRTFQKSSEFGQMTVLENLLAASPNRRGASVWGALRSRRYWYADEQEALEKAGVLLEQFDMAFVGDEYAGKLSTGQRRLVEIMRALMASPRLLLLDEPCSGLSPAARHGVEGHLHRLRDEGVTMLIVEHELGAVDRLTDSVVVMAQGQVLAIGAMDELRENPDVVEAYFAG